MSTLKRTLRDVGALGAAMVAVGASFGAISIAYGLPAWAPIAMSALVFAGGSQFLAAGLIAAGNPIAAILAGLLLNARHLPFGMVIASTLSGSWRDRLIGSHIMTDEATAFALASPDPVERRRIYWLVGTTLFITWNVGTVLGVLLGGATGNPDALGLDAAFPAALIALILPSLRDRGTRMVALVGAVVAVGLTPVLPAGLPVLCALLGLGVLFVPSLRGEPVPASDSAPVSASDSASVPASGSAPSSAPGSVSEGA
jgi:4-azaleucine resistance transporter AzlC